jgi:hypothetical protein
MQGPYDRIPSRHQIFISKRICGPSIALKLADLPCSRFDKWKGTVKPRYDVAEHGGLSYRLRKGGNKMVSIRKTAIAVAGLMVMAGGAYAASDWLKGSTEEQLKTLAGIQPGLGTVMIEFGNRYTDTYYAAKGGNWGLAAYMLKEALEIQEVGEATRPGRAAALKAFEMAYLEPLSAAIEAKDADQFEAAFQAGVKGCNGCHASQGFPYIEYVLPDAPPSPLKYSQ